MAHSHKKVVHSHHHQGGHHHHHPDNNIKVAFFLNLAFTIIEVIGGLMTNSMSILSDALHDLGDSLSIGLAWFLQKFSKKKSSRTFSYGYRRFSLLGAIINAIILIIGSAFILYNAIPRLYNPQPVNAYGMMWLAVLGIIVNGAAMFNLKKGISLNEEVLSLHLLEDVLGWVAVLIGSVIMYFYDAPFLDPLLSIGIALFLLYNVMKSLNKVTKVFLQGVPESINLEKIHSIFRNYKDIQDIHDLHIWTMDGEYMVLTAHLVLRENKNVAEIGIMKTDLRKELKAEGIDHATLEFEMEGDECVFINC